MYQGILGNCEINIVRRQYVVQSEVCDQIWRVALMTHSVVNFLHPAERYNNVALASNTCYAHVVVDIHYDSNLVVMYAQVFAGL